MFCLVIHKENSLLDVQEKERYTKDMQTTTIILLIILGLVSLALITVILFIGIKIWAILKKIERVTSFFSDETDQVKSILKKVRMKIHNIIE